MALTLRQIRAGYSKSYLVHATGDDATALDLIARVGQPEAGLGLARAEGAGEYSITRRLAVRLGLAHGTGP